MRDWSPSVGNNHIFAGFVGVSKRGEGRGVKRVCVIFSLLSAVCYFFPISPVFLVIPFFFSLLNSFSICVVVRVCPWLCAYVCLHVYLCRAQCKHNAGQRAARWRRRRQLARDPHRRGRRRRHRTEPLFMRGILAFRASAPPGFKCSFCLGGRHRARFLRALPLFIYLFARLSTGRREGGFYFIF